MMVIKIENVVKRYGELTALDHFSLSVKEGEIFGLLGPNGSGKSTLINCLLSLLKYDKGTIEVFGKPMTPTSYESKRNIGVIFQNVAVFDELTVYENIDYFCALYVSNKETRKKLVEEAIDFVDLHDFRKFYPKKLSGGLLRRLNIACGIAHQPKLIILDEPTVAVDPQSRNSILEGIKKLNQKGATIIYTTHYMEEVEQICTNIAIIDKGRMIATGTKEALTDMIDIGEKLTIELAQEASALLPDIKRMDGVASAEIQDNRLIIHSMKGKSNLPMLMTFLSEKEIAFGKIYAKPPTLNDVFLEITGKTLRDEV